MIDPFLSCLACDITFLARIFRKIRAKNVISQARQDKKGAMRDGPRLIDPFLPCLACDITFFARIFRKIRAKNVISQARQDKKGSIKDRSYFAELAPAVCFLGLIFSKNLSKRRVERKRRPPSS